MSITLHPEKGVNPLMTFCRQCGEDAEELMLVGDREYAEVCVECGLYSLGGRPTRGKCPKCERNNGWSRKPLSDFMHNGKLPAMEPCNKCRELNKAENEEVAKGGIHFRCTDCGSAGAVRGHAELAKGVRKHFNLAEPDDNGVYPPCGVEFSKGDCPVCGPHALKGEEE